VADSTGYGLSLTRLPTPLQMPIASSWSLGYPQLLFNLATNQALLRYDCLCGSQNSGKYLFMFTSLLKEVIKDTDEQSDEEIMR